MAPLLALCAVRFLLDLRGTRLPAPLQRCFETAAGLAWTARASAPGGELDEPLGALETPAPGGDLDEPLLGALETWPAPLA